MGRARSTNGAKRNAGRILVGDPESKRPLGRPRRRWVDDIKMDLRGLGWIDLAQDMGQWKVLLNTEMNLRVSYKVSKFLSGCTEASQEGLISMQFS
jgi:hypothetical protein